MVKVNIREGRESIAIKVNGEIKKKGKFIFQVSRMKRKSKMENLKT